MEKLQISDLSVGDWVFDGNGNTRQIACIDLQNGNYFVHFSDPDVNSEDYCHALDVTPIPLTVEILRKNTDFEEDSVRGRNRFVRYGDHYGTDFTVLLFPLHHYAQFYVGSEAPAARSDTYIRRIQYVHELQHALRLAGIDKEILL